MKKITMYTTGHCPYCVMAERLLATKGVDDIDKIRIDQDPHQFQVMLERTQRRTVPQIYIGDVYVGGFQELTALNHKGQLDELLQD